MVVLPLSDLWCEILYETSIYWCVKTLYVVEKSLLYGCVQNNYGLRAGRVLDVGLPLVSMLPVNSATRALILATRDSIAALVSI